MDKTTTNLQRELAILKTMAADLPDYLLAETVFWQMQGPGDFPKLSLGLMWLTRARLLGYEARLTPSERHERDHLIHQIEFVTGQKPVACENKATQELRQRLNLWRAFVADYAADPASGAEQYAREVTHRVIIALLLHHHPRLQDSAEAGRLAPPDAPLRARLRPGAFVWSEELQTQFPATEFWFLYGVV